MSMFASGTLQTRDRHPIPLLVLAALLIVGCAATPAAAPPPTTAAGVGANAGCPVLTPAERTERLLSTPGVSGPLTAGAIHIAAGGMLVAVDDSGSATALGSVSLGMGVAALTAAGIVALASDPNDDCEQATVRDH